MTNLISRKYLVIFAALAAIWGVFAAAGTQISEFCAKLAGAKLLALGQGKFTSPEVFIHGRVREFLLLITVALGLWFLGRVIDSALVRRVRFEGIRWTWLSLLGFIGLNLWIIVASQTAIFWLPFFDKKHVDNVAQFHLKKVLHPEQKAAKTAILIGNSQTSSNIDEVLLNQMTGSQLWTTELHQPGANGFDMLMLSRRLENLKSDYVITYYSPNQCYNRPNGQVISRYARWSDLVSLLSTGGWKFYTANSVRSGVFCAALPLFRYRESFSQRLLGGAIMSLEQRTFDAALHSKIDQQGKESAQALQLGPCADFEKWAFAEMTRKMVGPNRRMLVIAGRMHPAIESNISPEIRADFDHFLEQLVQEHNGQLIVIPQEEFFPVRPEHFNDLVHFNTTGQSLLSRRLVQVLEHRGWIPPQLTKKNPGDLPPRQ